MLLLAVVRHQRHLAVRILPILVLVLLIVGGVVAFQRHRDRRPLGDAPSPRTHQATLRQPTTEQRAVTDADGTPQPNDAEPERSGRALSTSKSGDGASTWTGKATRPGRYGISGLLRSEWTKLRTVRSTVWTLGVTVVLGIGVSVLATAETRAHWLTTSATNRQGFDPISTSLIGVLISQFAIGVLGVLVMSAEYGTGTIRATLSAAPRRPLVLIAKVIVFGAVALVVAEVVSFLAFVIGQALLTAPARHATLASPGAWRAVLGSGLYVAVLGLFSLGLATIIRHTAGAIAAFVGILLVLPLIVRALPTSLSLDVLRFLPDRIGAQIINGPADSLPNAFSPWVGLLILVGYTAAVLVIGGVLLVRRDA
jgi:ABC-2 type transport system permease protein